MTTPATPGTSASPALLLALSLGLLPAATAQVGEVVRPSASGDFVEVQRQGPRGPIPQRLWLVVDRDPAGLLCRDARGLPLLALRPGAVLEADSGPGLPSPLQLRSGRPYLRLRVKPVDILSDRRIANQGAQPHGSTSLCHVRAHGAYLAPVLVESLQALPATIRGH